MPDATSDFVIFLSMYLSNRYYHNRILHNIISEENAISLYMRYFQDEQIVERFSSFLKIIGCDKKPEIMLNEFQGILKEEIKKAQIAKAKNDYLLDKNTDFAHADLAHRIQDYLNEKFKPIISDEARKVSLIRVPILGINGFSNMSLENIINGQYDVIAQNLIYTLCDLLSKSNAVNHVKRNSFPDDESFFTFLKADGNDTIIGSKFSIRSSDYANREQLNDIISSKKSVLEGYTDRSLLIRENMLHIFIDDIRIGTHSGTLSEERNDIIFDSRTQSYLYEVTNNIPIEFNKDELLQYLHDRRKIVNIVLYISVHKEEDDKVDNPVSLYAATKKSNELMAHAYSKLYNIPSTGLRFFTVYGPAGRPDMAYFGFTNKLLAGDTIQIFNYGNCKRDFTYVDDIVEGVKRVMQCAPEKVKGEDGLPIPPYRVYNIGNNSPENLLDFVDILQQELIRAGVLPEDYDFEAHKKLVPMQPGDVPVTYADTSALERDFGFKPSTSLREGLRRFAEWYKEFYL